MYAMVGSKANPTPTKGSCVDTWICAAPREDDEQQ